MGHVDIVTLLQAITEGFEEADLDKVMVEEERGEEAAPKMEPLTFDTKFERVPSNSLFGFATKADGPVLPHQQEKKVDELRRQLGDATALVSAESDEVEKENENSKTEEVQMLQRQLEVNPDHEEWE
ncbi:unnamed protein product [Hyaloperonospora brassicae]|uniref:Uncharacterized protein n=1 Tax=Hyaloperonospora brassicae TaxID=162125 RepID=A0AAV0UEN8_HYABA|nr:unnamed protein product [Hyaloperonospora brassicae]